MSKIKKERHFGRLKIIWFIFHEGEEKIGGKGRGLINFFGPPPGPAYPDPIKMIF